MKSSIPRAPEELRGGKSRKQTSLKGEDRYEKPSSHTTAKVILAVAALVLGFSLTAALITSGDSRQN